MSEPVSYLITGSHLFQRAYSVSIQGSGQTSAVWGNESSTQSAIKVTFEVERAVTGGNKAKIVLYNLTGNSRQNITVGTPVKLRAGYVGLVGNLFLGIVHKVSSERNGPDIITSLELQDGEPYANMSVLDKAYGKNTHLTTILADVARAMTVDLNNQILSVKRGVALGIPDHVYAQGFVAHGPCREILDTLCRPRGLDWSVQNGALNVIPKTHYDGRSVQILSPKTGLIGIPSNNGKFFAFSALLNPKLVPGCLVKLETANESLVGTYKIRKVRYQGDTHDQAWQVDIEAIPYTGTLNPLPVAVGQTYTGAVTP